ncbi:MAG: tRNA pseudouridine(55) synthase TruB [Clostridia bacterium]|nr:tRNA pseudouridine(55) synthase TruB [Clostridia bacterium]
MNGFLSILKPPGMSSGAVVGRIRHLLPRGVRVGHAGTLDPAAAGVLPIMIGRATRLFDYTTDKAKTYLVEFIPGVETDTQDITGTVIQRGKSLFTKEEIEAVLPQFLGDIQQIPPMYSALKRDGRRLYDLARAGERIALEPRTVHVDSLRILFEEEGHFFIEITCGRGTYMRTICHDLGHALSSVGCMGMLIRTSAGPFDIQNSLTLEELGSDLDQKRLYPMDYPLMHLPAFTVPDTAEERHIRSGMPVPCDMETAENVPVRIYWRGQFCGIAHRKGAAYHFDCMLLE